MNVNFFMWLCRHKDGATGYGQYVDGTWFRRDQLHTDKDGKPNPDGMYIVSLDTPCATKDVPTAVLMEQQELLAL